VRPARLAGRRRFWRVELRERRSICEPLHCGRAPFGRIELLACHLPPHGAPDYVGDLAVLEGSRARDRLVEILRQPNAPLNGERYARWRGTVSANGTHGKHHQPERPNVLYFPFDVTPRPLQNTLDDQGEPWLKVTFELNGGQLRAWVHVERKPKLWATQELRPHKNGGWRLTGPIEWTDERWKGVIATARVKSRPGIDGQLHRIGPLISSGRSVLPARLREALLAASFEPRSARGRVRGPVASPYNETRALTRVRERRGEADVHEFPAIETMLPLGRAEQLDELRRAGLTSQERADWQAMHGRKPLASRTAL
jgi:hypothetical protein